MKQNHIEILGMRNKVIEIKRQTTSRLDMIEDRMNYLEEGTGDFTQDAARDKEINYGNKQYRS